MFDEEEVTSENQFLLINRLKDDLLKSWKIEQKQLSYEEDGLLDLKLSECLDMDSDAMYYVQFSAQCYVSDKHLSFNEEKKLEEKAFKSLFNTLKDKTLEEIIKQD